MKTYKMIMRVVITIIEIIIMALYKLDSEYSNVPEQLNSRKILNH